MARVCIIALFLALFGISIWALFSVRTEYVLEDHTEDGSPIAEYEITLACRLTLAFRTYFDQIRDFGGFGYRVRIALTDFDFRLASQREAAKELYFTVINNTEFVRGEGTFGAL